MRLSAAGVALIQEIADHYDCSWGEAARRMMQFGALGAPYRWPPEKMPTRGWGNQPTKTKGNGDG